MALLEMKKAVLFIKMSDPPKKKQKQKKTTTTNKKNKKQLQQQTNKQKTDTKNPHVSSCEPKFLGSNAWEKFPAIASHRIVCEPCFLR